MSGYGARASRTSLSTFMEGADGYDAQLAIKRAELTAAQAARVGDVGTYNWLAHRPQQGQAFPLFSGFLTGGGDETQANSRIFPYYFALTLTLLIKQHGGTAELALEALADYRDAMYDLVDRRNAGSVGSILGDDHVPGRVLEFRLGSWETVSDPGVSQPNIGLHWPRATLFMIEDY